MRKMVILTLAVAVLLGVNICLAQSPKDALRALQKLQARVESGISYRDYGPVLGDAKFEVNLFLRSPEAKEKPELATAIERTMGHYQMALVIWQFKFVRHSDDAIYLREVDISSVLRIYPKIQVRPSAYLGSWVYIPEALNVIWEEAAKELEKVISLFSQ
jgi:hypothetical protein